MQAVSDHPPPLVDGIAASASLLCLVHCLALPLLAASLPVLGILITHSAAVHALLLALALPLGVWALARGRQRAGALPLMLGLAGFALMGSALLMPESLERGLTIAGVSLVALAHWRNWRAGLRAQTSDASSIL
jgi:O-antigen ligase